MIWCENMDTVLHWNSKRILKEVMYYNNEGQLSEEKVEIIIVTDIVLQFVACLILSSLKFKFQMNFKGFKCILQCLLNIYIPQLINTILGVHQNLSNYNCILRLHLQFNSINIRYNNTIKNLLNINTLFWFSWRQIKKR